MKSRKKKWTTEKGRKRKERDRVKQTVHSVNIIKLIFTFVTLLKWSKLYKGSSRIYIEMSSVLFLPNTTTHSDRSLLNRQNRCPIFAWALEWKFKSNLMWKFETKTKSKFILQTNSIRISNRLEFAYLYTFIHVENIHIEVFDTFDSFFIFLSLSLRWNSLAKSVSFFEKIQRD